MAERKHRHGKLYLLLMALAAAGAAIWVGSSVLSVEEFAFTGARLPAGWDGGRLVVLSDLHGKRFGRQNSRLCNVNVDLCEEGYRQAALLGERLFPKNIQAVYSSDLLRAIETAQAANLYWNVEHMICPELREIDFGDMLGLSDTEIAVKYSDFKKEEGYKESIKLSKEYNLYRQDYCGCLYSKKERDEKKCQED